MKEFVSWCRHLLVLPLHFIEMIFHLFHSFVIHFGAKPHQNDLRRVHINFMHAHADNLHVQHT